MDRFQSMQLFTRIVELGSFTRAAEDLQLPRASVTLAVQDLEKRLGTRLLQRTTRHVSTTPDGQAYYERCQRLLADLEEAESAFGSALLKPRGKLRVDLQGTLARHFVLPRIGEFCERYPDVELEIGLGDRLVDLVREGVDCVLRGGELRDSTMVARRVALLQQVTCASREYLRRHGTPTTVDALRGHQAVNFLSQRTGKPLPFDFLVDGVARSVQLKGPVAVSDADAYHACCAAHLGLIQVPRYHIAPRLADGSLCEVLADCRPAPMPVSVLYPHSRQLSPRVRVFVDWLAQVMQDAH
ncbi:DNA-binding transcriptional LysR family regulator [Acidovorax delafieldii]|jgi:LysR family transcriptional regulator for bpeEF and oprC|uniref:DNA-binding transcriptional LysR family regulator n=1 Tax=Acidovorax delafieldii TaxID=47920 RepID=A0AAJ2F256_ACIDE|nr:LysR family transcriptional regulator [Acidovorax delafieldii]MDR6764853.1 DNA-binding transcriptional LysR family regulator [Acidovorax delafieldii]MDR6835290.1 DNA-binding transcriptional LysR family regulator [Acidovorax delafieldii]MDR7365740.1 DNA-binding transcriptional LysR family regulator [Acidovorax delafieldii]